MVTVSLTLANFKGFYWTRHVHTCSERPTLYCCKLPLLDPSARALSFFIFCEIWQNVGNRVHFWFISHRKHSWCFSVLMTSSDKQLQPVLASSVSSAHPLFVFSKVAWLPSFSQHYDRCQGSLVDWGYVRVVLEQMLHRLRLLSSWELITEWWVEEFQVL